MWFICVFYVLKDKLHENLSDLFKGSFNKPALGIQKLDDVEDEVVRKIKGLYEPLRERGVSFE